MESNKAIQKRRHQPIYKINTKIKQRGLKRQLLLSQSGKSDKENRKRTIWWHHYYFAFLGAPIIFLLTLCTVGENIIATIKIRNNFCYPLKLVIFPILQYFPLCILFCISSLLFFYRSLSKVVALPTIAIVVALKFDSEKITITLR